MKHTKMRTLIVSSIGIVCAVYIGFNIYSQNNIASAATDVRAPLLKSLNQNISDVTIKSNNIDKTIAKTGDVITLNYTLNKIPTKNTVLIDYQTITPVCERSVLIQKCSAAIVITKLFPINDGIVDFSIDSTFKDGKTESKTTVDDKTFVDIQRGFEKTVDTVLKVNEKTETVITNNTPTLVNALRLNTIVNNKLKSTTTSKASSEQLQKTLLNRKIVMTKLAKDKPIEYIYGMFPNEIAKKLSISFPDLIEKNVTETGILEVIHVDDFENEENSYFKYQLRQGEKVIPIYSVEALDRKSGDVVTITGSKLGDAIVLKSTNQITITNKPIPETVKNQPDSVGRQNTLVFLIRFPDSRPIPFSRRTAHRLIFGGQFQKFFKEQSYGKTSFSGRVMDWITIDYSNQYSIGLNNRIIQDVIMNNNIQMADYDRVLFLVEETGGGSSYVGKSDVLIDNVMYSVSQSWVGLNGYNDSYHSNFPFAWTQLDFLLSHEIGHALGVFHANGWECGETSLRGDCEHMEYGNNFDTMGNGAHSLHFNAFYKEALGWIKSNETEIITKSGTYTIKPLENMLLRFLLNNGPVKRIAKIKILGSDKSPFYIEYRKAIGFDRGLNDSSTSLNQKGLFINYVIDNGFWDRFPRLLDMTPHTVNNNTWENNYYEDTKNATLNGNNIFTDPDTGITVGPVVQNTGAKITFNVNMTDPVCIHRDPSIIDVQAGGWIGYAGYTYVKFYNADSSICSASKFTIENLILPPGWTGGIQINNINPVPPEHSEYIGADFNIPETVLVGTGYPISFELVNTSTGSRKLIETSIWVQQ